MGYSPTFAGFDRRARSRFRPTGEVIDAWAINDTIFFIVHLKIFFVVPKYPQSV
jgi:hypothetical protein